MMFIAKTAFHTANTLRAPLQQAFLGSVRVGQAALIGSAVLVKKIADRAIKHCVKPLPFSRSIARISATVLTGLFLVAGATIAGMPLATALAITALALLILV